jgi:hypothetical protein
MYNIKYWVLKFLFVHGWGSYVYKSISYVDLCCAWRTAKLSADRMDDAWHCSGQYVVIVCWSAGTSRRLRSQMLGLVVLEMVNDVSEEPAVSIFRSPSVNMEAEGTFRKFVRIVWILCYFLPLVRSVLCAIHWHWWPFITFNRRANRNWICLPFPSFLYHNWKFRQNDCSACHILLRWFIAWLILPWRWRWRVPAKHLLTLDRPHNVISQKLYVSLHVYRTALSHIPEEFNFNIHRW